jgi:uncharacterized membrane protein YkvA (DUF1232 family)
MPDSRVKRVVPTNQGMMQDLLLKIKLIYRLMGDNRVNAFLKAIPVASLIYLISPIDFMPFLPFDDIAVVGLGMYLFIELCPQYVVEEHLTNLRTNIPRPFQNSARDEVVVDAEFRDADHPEKE